MTLPRKFTRPITVEGAQYRWMVKETDDAEILLVIECAANPNGPQLVGRIDRRDRRPDDAIVPSIIAAIIRDARLRGWDPGGTGDRFYCDWLLSDLLRERKYPPIAEQLAALERFIGREVPAALRDVYFNPDFRAFGLLPLSTGREHGPPLATGSDGERFLDAQARLDSVLGQAMAHTEAAQSFDDHVWPSGLLVIEDSGCAIYCAVDLDDPNLRVIQYEHFDPVDAPNDSPGDRPAFREPTVPRNLQHRFTIVADSLADWLLVKRLSSVAGPCVSI